MKPLTYLLVDFENLQPSAKDVALVRGDECRLWVFHGPHQNKFTAEMVVAWQPLGDHVRFVQSSKTGKNALDFHIAFYLGQAQQQDAGAGQAARYIVVSGDGGFDALFDHMRRLGYAVGKAATIPQALALAESLLPTQPAIEVAVPGSQQVASTSALAVSKGPASIVVQSGPKPHESPPAKKAAKDATPAPRNTLADDDVEKVIAELRAHPNNRPADREALERHIVSVLRNKVTIQVSTAVIKALELQQFVKFNGKKIEYKVPEAKK